MLACRLQDRCGCVCPCLTLHCQFPGTRCPAALAQHKCKGLATATLLSPRCVQQVAVIVEHVEVHIDLRQTRQAFVTALSQQHAACRAHAMSGCCRAVTDQVTLVRGVGAFSLISHCLQHRASSQVLLFPGHNRQQNCKLGCRRTVLALQDVEAGSMSLIWSYFISLSRSLFAAVFSSGSMGCSSGKSFK